MTTGTRDATRLLVIGGGFTGALVAIQAMRAPRPPRAITIIEPRADLGRGIAYGTRDPAHRINVPSDRMGLFAANPAEATQWIESVGGRADPAARDVKGDLYVARSVYGDFMGDVLRAHVRAAEGLAVTHERASVTGLAREGRDWIVTLGDGRRIAGDAVALCFGHATPASPAGITPAARGAAKFVGDPWAAGALRAIASDDTVLVLGTGLTMADVVASLRARGHRGRITAISRRGLLPRGHGLFRGDLDLFQGEPAPRTALGLLRLIRRRVRAEAAGLGWHPVMDSLRARLPEVWPALPPREKRRVMTRLLPFWEVHRFRIAPQIAACLDAARRSGDLVTTKGAMVALDWRDGRFAARLRLHAAPPSDHAFDAVVLCTGPEKDLRGNRLFAGLLDAGLARFDDTGLGLAVDSQSRLIDAAGTPSPTLRAFGPMTRGSFGEMTGAPDIAGHVERVSHAFLDAIAHDDNP